MKCSGCNQIFSKDLFEESNHSSDCSALLISCHSCDNLIKKNSILRHDHEFHSDKYSRCKYCENKHIIKNEFENHIENCVENPKLLKCIVCEMILIEHNPNKCIEKIKSEAQNNQNINEEVETLKKLVKRLNTEINNKDSKITNLEDQIHNYNIELAKLSGIYNNI